MTNRPSKHEKDHGTDALKLATKDQGKPFQPCRKNSLEIVGDSYVDAFVPQTMCECNNVQHWFQLLFTKRCVRKDGLAPPDGLAAAID
jgi:hypothetical protein